MWYLSMSPTGEGRNPLLRIIAAFAIFGPEHRTVRSGLLGGGWSAGAGSRLSGPTRSGENTCPLIDQNAGAGTFCGDA